MNKNLTVLIVEDNFLNRRLIKKVLEENGYTITEATNVSTALNILDEEQTDLAILDIHLGQDESDGISLGTYIREKYLIPFIYLTAYETPDIINSALSSNPSSYITKPFKNVDLLTSVEIAIRQSVKNNQHIPALLVKDGEYFVEININDVDYIESEGNYLLIYSKGKTYKHRTTIKNILELLPEDIFVQTHRGFIANKNKIEKYNAKSLIVNQSTIPVSKKYTDHIFSAMRRLQDISY